MKKIPVFITCAGIIIMFFSGAAFSRDFMNILKFDKGEMFNDFSNASQALSKEHGKDGKVCMKITYNGKGWMGEMNPARKVWSDFSRVQFVIFNDSTSEREIRFTIKGAKEPPNAPENTSSTPLTIPPGESTQTVDLTKIICLDGKSPLDYSKIYIYAFSSRSEEPLTIYISDFKLIK